MSEPLPPGYVDRIAHPTSVKTIYVVQRPTATEPGVADFKFNSVFSVFDYGTLPPPVPLDNSTVALMAAFNFERLRELGVPSHYLSMVHEGEPISAGEAIARGVAPDTLRVRLVNRLLPRHTSAGWDYAVFADPPSRHFVVPVEFISRVTLPTHSSVWKRIDRGELSPADLGLPETIRPGECAAPTPLRGRGSADGLPPPPSLPHHILDYSTKYEPEDRYLRGEEARALTSFSPERWERINATTRRVSEILTDYAASKGVQRDDGKVEYVTLDHAGEVDVLGDAVTTLHEDRLVLDGLDVTKQAIRDAIRRSSPEWAAEIDRAKREARARSVADFRTLMGPAISYVSPPAEFFERYNALARAFVNHWVGAAVYPEDRDLPRRLREFRAAL
jgi:phosphoribosylaminoimidazole-succinocarboxamide synthase